MGRTYANNKDFDEWDSPKKGKKHSKHSRNLPGRGMRVINNLSEDDYEDDFELDDQYDDEYYDTQR